MTRSIDQQIADLQRLDRVIDWIQIVYVAVLVALALANVAWRHWWWVAYYASIAIGQIVVARAMAWWLARRHARQMAAVEAETRVWEQAMADERQRLARLMREQWEEDNGGTA